MKKLLLTILALTLVLPSVFAQKIGGRGGALTLPDLDSQVVQKYRHYSPKLEAVIDAYKGELDTAKRVVLERQFNDLQKLCDADMLGVYTKNVKVTGVAERIYSLRTSIPKDQLEKIYKKFSADVRRDDPYAKSIRLHLDMRQVELGDTLGNFQAITSDGLPFRYSEFKDEKDVLIIFGGLNSLPVEARMMLQINYRNVDLSKLELISVMTDITDKTKFEAEARSSGIEWLKLCDYRGDHSPLKIAFGVQATPMCFYVSRGGAVEYISVGITDVIIELMEQQSYKNRK